MPATVASHLAQAEANKVLARKMISPNCGIDPLPLEWAAVVASYSAIHYVNAALLSKGVVVSDHKTRQGAMAKIKELSPAIQSYGTAFNYGFRARYTPGWRLTLPVIRGVLDVDIQEVEAIVRSCLAKWSP